MNSILIFKGPSWRNCGASEGQENALASDTAFQATVTNQYAALAGQNSAILNTLTTGATAIFNGGPSQQGESPAELAVQNSQAINNAAAANKQVQQEIGEKAATNGVVPGVESGVVQAIRANASTAIANNLSNQESNITQQNYEIGRQNYNNAAKLLETAPAEIESATNQAAGVVNNANSITGTQANENQKANSQWEGLVSSLAGDAASLLKPLVSNSKSSGGGGGNT
jgi:hypothetical protein